MKTSLSHFVKERRKVFKLTQEGLSQKAGVGLRFIRDLEQGKTSLRLDKVNQVLSLFNYEVGPVPTRFLPESEKKM
ncbi:type II toxin-antitoxin system Y4mF family antitoxin [Rudanella paleaurantiibacter]|uniref:Type II toxin-antitoxin system Y4mF family antitoxin n=1 Tax=Rudanella paleaurantiibacter TaxID=2614655 RepID=A0A7J5U4B0_9BACT|nr:helix-turn-helix transcriptional regulator [Rudanella paleaurantiibacter]KAB7732533.1 type II toxin-antitoxin system Y4mF family antitoxin [Rudanella paleaurantiibacter]